jgi:hypothetical protein
MARNLEAHPLFPAKNDDEEAPEVIVIKVSRREANGMAFVPETFAADALVDESQIYERFGGGVYELIARDNRAITARRGLVLAGPSKPLFPDPPPSAHQPASSGAPAAAPPPAGAPAWLGIVSVFMPMLLQWLTGQQQQSRDSQQAMQTLMVNMMQQSQQSNQQMVTMLSTLNRPASSPQGADFKEGMNFMQELLAGQLERVQAQKEEQGESESIMATIGQLMQGIELLKGFSSVTGDAPPVGTTAPAAAESAA